MLIPSLCWITFSVTSTTSDLPSQSFISITLLVKSLINIVHKFYQCVNCSVIELCQIDILHIAECNFTILNFIWKVTYGFKVCGSQIRSIKINFTVEISIGKICINKVTPIKRNNHIFLEVTVFKICINKAALFKSNVTFEKSSFQILTIPYFVFKCYRSGCLVTFNIFNRIVKPVTF